jgi:hypothetical protein
MCANGSLNPMFHNYFLFVLIQLNQFCIYIQLLWTLPYDTTTNLFVTFIIEKSPIWKAISSQYAKLPTQI